MTTPLTPPFLHTGSHVTASLLLLFLGAWLLVYVTGRAVVAVIEAMRR